MRGFIVVRGRVVGSARSQRLVYRLVRCVSLLAVLTLVAVDGAGGAAAMPSWLSASGARSAVSSAAVKSARVGSRPDAVSAGVSARAQGSRVEVLSLRSRDSTTWANPDGTLTTEQSAGLVRFKDAAGAWRAVDLSLSAKPAADGAVGVVSSAQDVVFGGAGADEAGKGGCW